MFSFSFPLQPFCTKSLGDGPPGIAPCATRVGGDDASISHRCLCLVLSWPSFPMGADAHLPHGW